MILLKICQQIYTCNSAHDVVTEYLEHTQYTQTFKVKKKKNKASRKVHTYKFHTQHTLTSCCALASCSVVPSTALSIAALTAPKGEIQHLIAGYHTTSKFGLKNKPLGRYCPGRCCQRLKLCTTGCVDK